MRWHLLVCSPGALVAVRHRFVKRATCVRCLWSIKQEYSIEQSDLGGHLHHFASSGVERAFRGTDKKPKKYGGHGANQSKGKLYGISGIFTEVLRGKSPPQTG